ncbi:YceI family protein [Gillisia marina]|uniref:YceI family protein n=1 Tax=Gillisia marina TaxID=1167637 RepID=UPI00029A3119|nr:YceI family protein [Gillisia marina]
MKKLLKLPTLVFVLFFLGFYNGIAQNAEKWKLDKDHTSVNFEVKHLFNTVNGNFKDFDGTFYFDPDNLKESKFTFTVPISSIETNNEKRNNHLKSPDFFNAEKYPDMKFVSTGFQKKSENKYLVDGKLRIKDVTKNVSIPFEITGTADHPMMEGTKIMGLAFNTEINRNDYKVGAGDWTSTKIVGENVKVSINAELNK